MSFREKKAWVTMLALVIVFFPYYFFMVQIYHQSDPNFRYVMNLAAMALAVFIVLEWVLILVVRKLSPKDARDQLFAYSASQIAYVTLILLVVAVTFPMIHIHGGNWDSECCT